MGLKWHPLLRGGDYTIGYYSKMERTEVFTCQNFTFVPYKSAASSSPSDGLLQVRRKRHRRVDGGGDDSEYEQLARQLGIDVGLEGASWSTSGPSLPGTRPWLVSIDVSGPQQRSGVSWGPPSITVESNPWRLD